MTLGTGREGDQCWKPGQHMEIALHIPQQDRPTRCFLSAFHRGRPKNKRDGLSQWLSSEQHHLGSY